MQRCTAKALGQDPRVQLKRWGRVLMSKPVKTMMGKPTETVDLI